MSSETTRIEIILIWYPKVIYMSPRHQKFSKSHPVLLSIEENSSCIIVFLSCQPKISWSSPMSSEGLKLDKWRLFAIKKSFQVSWRHQTFASDVTRLHLMLLEEDYKILFSSVATPCEKRCFVGLHVFLLN